MCEEAFQQHKKREDNTTFLIGDSDNGEGVVNQSLTPMDVHCSDPTRAELNNPMNEVIDTIYDEVSMFANIIAKYTYM